MSPGSTNSAGDVVFAIPQQYLLPGDYVIQASAAKLANAGAASGTYHIGL